jgi:hypothetical protein
MKVFAAASVPDPREGGFSYAIPGELVYVGEVCATDARYGNPATGRCGCGRSFSGVTSRHATTLAVVVEMDMTRETYVDVLSAGVADAYPGRDYTDLAAWLADFAAELPVGSLVARSGWEVFTYAGR